MKCDIPILIMEKASFGHFRLKGYRDTTQVTEIGQRNRPY